MALVAIEALALTTVAHVAIFDRDVPLGSDALPNPRAPTRRVWLEVLIAKLAKRGEQAGERRHLCLRRHVLADPRFECVELLNDGHDSAGLLLGITPLEVEGLLDARLGKHRGARGTSDVRGLAIEHRGLPR